MKQYSKLREVLINCVVQITNTELTGYIVYDGGDMEIVHPDYSKEKGILLDMIQDCEEMSGLEKGESKCD